MIKIKLSNNETKELIKELTDGIFSGEIKITNDSNLNQDLYKLEKAHIDKAITDNLINNKDEYRDQVDRYVKQYSKNVAHNINISINKQLSEVNKQIASLKQRINKTNRLSHQLENNYNHLQDIKDKLDQASVQSKYTQQSTNKLDRASNAFKTTFRTDLFNVGLLGIVIGFIVSISLFFLFKLFF